MRKVLLVLIVLNFWIFFPINLLMLGTEFILLKPETYKNILIKNDAYNEFINIISSQLNVQINAEGANLLPLNDYQNLIRDSFSPVWIQQNVEKIIDNIFFLIKGQRSISELDLIISCKEPKDKFIAAFNLELIKQAPADLINSADLFKDIPDNFNAQDYLTNNPKINAYFYILPQMYKYFKISIFILFIINGLLFLAIILLLRKKIKSLVRWLGLSLLIPSALSMPLAILFKYFMNPLYEMLVVTIIPASYSPEILIFFNKIMFDLGAEFFGFFIVPLTVFSGCGLLLLILSFFVKKNN